MISKCSQQKEKQKDKVYLNLQEIVKRVKNNKSQSIYIIGICGIPGAGKSYISDKIQQKISQSLVIPMDGFHIYRKDLDEQGTRRRGAPFTFDLLKFKQKLVQLKKGKYPIYFPSFDHALKDPVQNDIEVSQNIKYVIVEGLYIFDKSLQLDQIDFWNMKIFIDEGKQSCLPRVIKRCIDKKIQQTQQKAIQRALNSDMVNGDYVIANSQYKNVFYIKNPV